MVLKAIRRAAASTSRACVLPAAEAILALTKALSEIRRGVSNGRCSAVTEVDL